MKKILFIILINLALGLTAVYSQQCIPTVTDSCVEVHQSILDRMAKSLDELKAARELIKTYERQVLLTDAERAAYKSLVQAMQDAFDARGKIVTDQTTIIALQQKVIQTYSDLVEKLTAAINKKQTGFQKFLQVLEKIAILAAGVSIGRL